MTLIQKIKEAQLVARKARATDIATLLTTLIGEADAVGKNKGNRAPSDDEVVAVIGKFIKNAKETIAALPQYVDNTPWVTEITVLSAYLPKQMDDSALNAAIARAILHDGPSKGAIMKYLKQNYAGQYDSRRATELIDLAA